MINYATLLNFFTAMHVGYYVNLLIDLKHVACPIVFNQDSKLVGRLPTTTTTTAVHLPQSCSNAVVDPDDNISWVVSRIDTL